MRIIVNASHKLIKLNDDNTLIEESKYLQLKYGLCKCTI